MSELATTSIDPVPAIAGQAAVPSLTRSRPSAAALGPAAWARRNLFGSVPSSIATIVFVLLIGRELFSFLDWAVVHAVWSVPDGANGQPDTTACRDAKGVGACWALIGEKYRFMLFGRYTYEEQCGPAW